MKILCTFSGQFGDALWSLPTARAITELRENFSFEEAENNQAKVDFGIMPGFKSLLPLLNAQPYIGNAFAIDNWIETGRSHGCQPWEAPVVQYFGSSLIGYRDYDKVYHLTYRNHPGKDQPLIDFIAGQQGIQLKDPIPFISTNAIVRTNYVYIAYAFNDSMKEQKDAFLAEVKRLIGSEIEFVDISQTPWELAAITLSNPACLAFIGCRSANYVLSCGVGQRVFVYEPNTARSSYGYWGTTFTCPYANETELWYGKYSIEQMIEEIKSKLVEVK